MKPHKCSDCGKAFAEAAKLSDHKLTHSGVKPQSCDMCDAKFTLKHHLSPSTGHVFQVLRDEPNVGFGSNRTWASVPGKSGYGSGWVFFIFFLCFAPDKSLTLERCWFVFKFSNLLTHKDRKVTFLSLWVSKQKNLKTNQHSSSEGRLFGAPRIASIYYIPSAWFMAARQLNLS